MKPLHWFACVVLLVALALGAAQTGRYVLDSQRCQNDGIVKHFDYRRMFEGHE